MPRIELVVRLVVVLSIVLSTTPPTPLSASPARQPRFQTEEPSATPTDTPPAAVTATDTATVVPTDTPTSLPSAQPPSGTETATVPPTDTTMLPSATSSASPAEPPFPTLVISPLITTEMVATETPPPPTPLEATVEAAETERSGFQIYLPLIFKYDEPQADFTADSLIGPVPLTITFVNSSTHATNFLWDFGDGTTDTVLNPSHTYIQAGAYTVTLIASDGVVSDTLTRVNFITPFKFSSDVATVTLLSASPATDVGDYAVLGLNSVWFRQGSDLHSGQVGAQTVSPGPVLDSGAEVTIGENVTFHDPTSAIAGDTVKLKQSAEVFGIFYNQLDAAPSATYGQVITPLTLPLVNNLPTLPPINPGSTSYTLAQNESLTLPAGAYGQIQLSKKASLTLTGGIYHLANLNLGDQTRLQVTAPTELRIANRLEPGQGAIIGPAPGSGLNATDLVLFVAGINGNSGNLGGTPKAAIIGENNIVTATLYAPNGTLWLRQGTQAKGAFIAKDVQIGEQVQVWLENAFAGGYQSPGTVVANFAATPLSGPAPLTVTFTNSSTNASGYLWTFGDGATSTEVNPIHSYAQAGVYTVTLTATGPGGSQTLTRTHYITVFEPVIASFSATPLSGTAPLTVTFSNSSTGATDYLWDFGTGATLTVINPTYTYAQPGVYTVTLIASDGVVTDTLTRTNYITVYEPVVADFVAVPLTGTVPLTVTFTNSSAGATDFLWDFGDGTPGSTAINPTHSYTQAAVYTVTLTATGPSGSHTLTRTNYITVTEPVVAAFSATPLTGIAPLTVTFVNSSTGATDYLWDFGNGATLTVISPTYTYVQPGVYTVTLTASGPGGSDTLTRTNYIMVTEPVVAAFSATPLTGTVPLTVTFVNSSTGASSYLWDFGDGTFGSTVVSPTHTYTQAGVYTITLAASDGPVTDTLTQTSYITAYEPVVTDFVATPLTGVLPLTVTFINSSTNATDYLWDFGDGMTNTIVSPTHIYTQVGIYTVTLTASNGIVSNTLTRLNYITVTAPIVRDWELITTTTSPPIIGEHSLAYDSTRNVVVLYGGNATGWPYENTTWEFDGADWNVIPTTLSPVARYGTSLAYDPVRHVTVLFGGGNQQDTALNQTWEYTNTSWGNVSPATSPLSRTYASLATNPVSGTLYLFGGNDHAQAYFNDLWRYENGVWTEIIPNGDSPPARTLAALVYVPSPLGGGSEGGLLLFGGRTITGTLLADLWAFDPVSETWTELDDGSGTGPSARMAHSLTYDPDIGKVVLVGGVTDEGDTRLGDTWHHTPPSFPPLGGTEGGWTEADPATPLPPLAYHQAVYADNAIILFSARQLWRYE